MKRHIFLFTVAISLTGLSLLAQSTTAPKPAAGTKPATSSTSSTGSNLPSESTINGFMKQMFGWNQDLTWKIAEIKPSETAGISQVTVVLATPKGQQPMKFYITPDQKYAFAGELMPFGTDPFAATRDQLKAANGPAHGAQRPAITIVEFGDLQCPACKAAQPNITKLMEEEPKAKLIFQNYPLESIHKWAMTGAKFVDCLARTNNDVTWKFIATVYDHQAEVNEQNVETMLKGYVKDSGGDPEAVAACAAKPETEKRVRESMALAEKLDVTSTPTFFINGRRIVGFSGNSVPYDVVKQMVDFDLNSAK
jgi:protein-disulfide isomerase